MAQGTATKEKVFILKAEYKRLKKLDQQFGAFLTYAEHLIKIRDARGEAKKKIVSQEKLFRRHGL